MCKWLEGEGKHAPLSHAAEHFLDLIGTEWTGALSGVQGRGGEGRGSFGDTRVRETGAGDAVCAACRVCGRGVCACGAGGTRWLGGESAREW
jgi:hypothetical protein